MVCYNGPYKIKTSHLEYPSFTLHLPNTLQFFPPFTLHVSLLKHYRLNDGTLLPFRERLLTRCQGTTEIYALGFFLTKT